MSNEIIENIVPNDNPASQHLKRFMAICANSDDGIMQFEKFALDEDHLIVLCEPEVSTVFALNLVTTARFPVKIDYDELRKLIDEGSILLAEYTFDKKTFFQEEGLNNSLLKRMNERYKAILPLILDLDNSLKNGYNSGTFAQAAKDAQKGVRYIYDTFYSFLRHGCRKTGLTMPQGKDANYFPEPRKIKTKLGRISSHHEGKLLNEYDYKSFEWAKNKYSKTARLTIEKVVDLMKGQFYRKSRSLLPLHEQKLTGKKYDVKLKEDWEIPTYNQFYYWLKKECGGVLPRRDKGKTNATEFSSDIAGRKGTPGSWVTGPGEEFQLDETPFDEEAVSAFDPTRQTKIGKPTVYFVKDRWSRCIAGLYITTQNPSYDTVKEALFNSGRDKGKFFEELGLPFDSSLMPISGNCLTLKVDRGEFHNHISEGPITSDVPITIKFSRTGRGDDKGMIEKMFDTWSQFFQGLSPAHQTKSRRDIAKQVARKNACLTIPELYEIAIVYIIHYNNHQEIKDFPAPLEMKRDGVPPIPAKIWEWGIKYRPGYLQAIPDEQLYLDLLETADATVYQDHVLLLGTKLKYTCDWTLKKGHQDYQKGAKQKKFKARIHRGCVDFIYLVTKEGLQVATLHSDHIGFIGHSFEEVNIQQAIEGTGTKKRKKEALESKLGVMYLLQEKVRVAISEKLPAAMQDIQKIRENRMFESMFERQKQINRLYMATYDGFYSDEPTKENSHEEESDSHDNFTS
jgi:hypothetical protein